MRARVLLVSLLASMAAGYPGAASTSQWLKMFGGRGYDPGRSIAERSDGSFVVVGGIGSNDGDSPGGVGGYSDLWVMTLDPNGQVLGNVRFGGGREDVAEAVDATRDGGVVVAGYCYSKWGDVLGHHGPRSTADACVLKLDQDLDVQWTRSIGGRRNDFARSVIQTADGGFIVAGDSYSSDGDLARVGHCDCAGTSDFMVAKLSETGELEWIQVYGGSNHEYLSQVIQRRDGTLLVVGRTESFDHDVQDFMGEYDAWLIAIDEADGRLLWEKTLGGSLWDWGSGVTETADGGFAVAGYTYSWDGDGEGNHGEYDYFIKRFDANGNALWSRVYGGLVDDFPHAIVQLDDGTFVVSGASVSIDGDITEPRGNFDLWTIRVSADGELLHQRSMGGSGYDINGLGRSLIQTADGDLVVVGESESNDADFEGMNKRGYDLFVMKMSVAELGVDTGGEIPPPPDPKPDPDAPPAGPAIAWQKTLGGTGAERVLDAPQAIAVLAGGGYAFVGEANSSDGDVSTPNAGSGDIWVVRTDALGNVIWDRSFGGTDYDYGAAIAEVRDGLILVGTTWSRDGDMSGNHGRSDIFVAKLSLDGETIWTRILGGSGQEFATSVAATPQGGVIVGGHASSADGDVSSPICAYDYWLVKLNSKGNTVWERSFGGTSNDHLIQVIATSDGGYAAIGRTESSRDGDVPWNHGTYDYFLIKTSANGALEWSRNYGAWDWEWGNSLVELPDGGFVLSGYTYTFEYFDGDVSSNHGEFDYRANE